MDEAMVPRKISLDALRVFESAARHLSFTKAAAELMMTQGAVSQRIQTLEARLGTKLFRRLTRALELSPDGERLYEGLHVGLARVEAALTGFRSSRDTRALTLTVSSSLATRWLMRRASALAQLKPAIAISIIADDRLLEVGIDADVALRFGCGRYRGLKSLRIGDDEVFPVCSPSFLAAHPDAMQFAGRGQARKSPGLTRLVDTVAEADGSGCGWRSWGEAAGMGWDSASPTTKFSHAHLALQAAAEGLGIALARRVLAADDLASGRLVRVGHNLPTVPARFGYYFVTRGHPDAREQPLASWLRDQLALNPSP
jgi:LysR family glycine cleavage system transcriptional activator